jgi:hypothetical protein
MRHIGIRCFSYIEPCERDDLIFSSFANVSRYKYSKMETNSVSSLFPKFRHLLSKFYNKHVIIAADILRTARESLTLWPSSRLTYANLLRRT